MTSTTLVREAIANGADAIGVAGGDGARRRSSPRSPLKRGSRIVCVPAGTRNHFALDLGVDRDDVVGALDAFTKGGRAGRGPRGGQRPRVREQRIARLSTPKRSPARGVPRREAPDPSPRRCRGARPRGRRPARPALHGRRTDTSRRPARSCSSATRTRTGSEVRAIASGTRPRHGRRRCLASRPSEQDAAGNGHNRVAAVVRNEGSKSNSDRPVAGPRRRSADTRPAPCASQPGSKRPAGADRSATPRRLPIGQHPGKPVGRDPRGRPHRHARLPKRHLTSTTV